MTTFSTFNPEIIPWQDKAYDQTLEEFDYSLGVHEVLLSGAIGSGKSVLGCHMALNHVMSNIGSRCLIARRTLPDLKKTLFITIMELLDESCFKEGKHYGYRETTGEIWFPPWKSEMIPGTWADKRYKKFRSLQLSMALIEELTENNQEDKQAYDEIVMRLNRISTVRQNLVVAMTNPDSPAHWAYRYFIESENKLRHVFYSITEDNPFLPKSYIDKLKSELDPRMAERMLFGKWTEVSQDKIYYSYETDLNFVKSSYAFDPALPVDVMHDFNISLGKPMSAAVGQVKNGIFHVAATILIDGARTNAICEEIANRGYYEKGSMVRVYGDATGKHSDSRNVRSDYDIIRQFLANLKRKDGTALAFEMNVPQSNPAIRDRHNCLNALFCNAKKERSMFIYKEAKDADVGFRLTNLKKGAQLTEDDTLREQHVTTAVGYWAHYIKTRLKPGPIQIT